MSLALPSGLRRAEIRSFYLATSGIFLILSLAMGLSSPWVYATAVIVLFSVLGIIYPRLMKIPYRIWNKCAKIYGRFARLSLLAICYYIVMTTVGLTALSGQFASARCPSSCWVLRRPLPGFAYDSQYEASDPLSLRAPWIAGFVSWAWRTGNIWTVCLLPFLIMISVLESAEEAATHVSDIYTLF